MASAEGKESYKLAKVHDDLNSSIEKLSDAVKEANYDK
jgi:hypothetical protein